MNELPVSSAGQIGDLEVALRMMLQGTLLLILIAFGLVLCLCLVEWWAQQRRRTRVATPAKVDPRIEPVGAMAGAKQGARAARQGSPIRMASRGNP
jgi:hypothetical protein